mgnify:FL=1
MNHLLLSIALVILTGISSFAANIKVYVLRIDDEIGSTTWQYTRNALIEADKQNADMLLVHLNTYGGEVLHADSIRTALLHYSKPVVAFVDNNAASAGALIALACDSVFMRPDASMGAATVVNGVDGAAMPDKYQSYMRAMMRATAESHGKVMKEDSTMQWRRNPLVAEAMVDTRIEVPGLIDSTNVLTFTPDEAIKWGFADGKAESIKDALNQLNVKEYSIEQYQPKWETTLIGFLTNPAVQAILITLILGGLYFEMHSPGMGFPTVVACTAALLYFLPLCLGGVVSAWVVVLFAIGIVLMLLELFVIPGFGICGISGIAAMGVAIIAALIQSFSIPETGVTMNAIGKAIGTFMAAILLTVGLAWYLTSRYGPKFVRRHTELMKSQLVEDGYIGVDTSMREYVGHEAEAATDMRPGGKIIIHNQEFDAVSERGYIAEGTHVIVTRFENAQLYVVPIKHSHHHEC